MTRSAALMHAVLLVVSMLALAGCGGGSGSGAGNFEAGSAASTSTSAAVSGSPSPAPPGSPSPTPTVAPTPTPNVLATRLVFQAAPVGTTAFARLAVIKVAVVDANGDLVAKASGKVGPAVTLTISGGARLLGTVTVNAVDGVATFDNVSIVGTGAFTLGATSPGLSGPVPQPIAVTVLPVDYPTRRDYRVTANPLQVAIADFNNDGRVDFINAPRSANTASVYLGQRDGGFLAAPPLAGLGAVLNLTCATGDFDRDGKQDVLFSLGALRQVQFFKGNGDGTFAAGVAVNGDLPSTIVVGDLDGDGLPDFVDNDLGASVSVWLGKGDGTFTLKQSLAITSAAINPTAIALADVNGDGVPDLVYADSTAVQVALGVGDGSFSPTTSIPFNAPEGVATGDVNGDGRLDLLVTDTQTTQLSLALGNGDGSFQTPVAYPLTSTPSALVAADFNGDGRADVAVGHQAGNVLDIFFGQANGTLTAAPALSTAGGPFGVVLGASSGSQALFVANDLTGSVSVVGVNGDGTFRDASADPVLGNTDGSAIGDVNGDGKADLVTFVGTSNTVRVLLGNNDGTFHAGATVTAAGSGVLDVALVDLDRDGRLDLLMQSDTTFQVCRGNGDGTFGAPVGYGGATTAFTTGDFNADGIVDVALANTAGSAVVLLVGKGDGTFAPPRSTPTGTSPQTLGAGDFDGDGKLDLAVGTTAGVQVLLGKGDGTFQAPATVSASTAAALATGDVNGDGRADIMYTSANGLFALLSKGGGTFTETLVDASVTSSRLRLADINGDGRLDAVYGAPIGVGISTGNGDGTFSVGRIFGTPSIAGVSIGDLNGDYKPDLVVSGSPSVVLVHP